MDILKKLGIEKGALSNKVAIVTGGARGIGKSVAQTLGYAGARVIIADISETGVETAQNLVKSGINALFIKTDLRVEEEIHELIMQTERKFGQVDILVNNAAFSEVCPLMETSIDVWDQTYQTNLRGTVIATKAVLPGMIDRKTGTIVTLISAEGLPLIGSYSAIKTGIRSFISSLSKELSPQMGVSIFGFFPGMVNTELVKESVPKLVHYTGLTVEKVVKQMANNPGYDDFMPVEHCSASLVNTILNSNEYYGQVVDAFYPLVKVGIIKAVKDVTEVNNLNIPNPKIEMAELINLNQNLEIRINERTKELEEKNRQLAEALEHLSKTQEKLIQSEKMASLGQLISGVAHEINTPIGAIQASSSNINNYLEQILDILPELMSVLSGDKQKLFFELVQRSLQKNLSLTTKEERTLRREISRQLDDLGMSDPGSIADILVDMGIYDQIEDFIPLLQDHRNSFFLQTAFNLTGLHRNTKNINLAVERAAKIIFALRSYGHYNHSEEKVEADVITGIETVLTIYQNQIKQNIELVKNYQDIPLISCYPDDLNQVWTNLIHNALQAMEYKGKLEIDVLTRNENVIIDITDNGTGILEEIRDKIFQPFFTTKGQGEGMGIGLDIVKKIIDKHQGDISVNSIPGKTTFRVRLPIGKSVK